MKSNKYNIFNILIESKQQSLLLNVKPKDELNNFIFEKKFSYKDLLNHKFLSKYKSIDEIYEKLKLGFKNNSFNLKEDENKIAIVVSIEGSFFKSN